MKGSLLLTLGGLIFGLAFGCWGGFIAYLDSLPDPFSATNHCFDWLLLLPSIFSVPGMALNYWIFNPPDGNYGDEWENYTPALFFNGLFWMIVVPIVSFLKNLAKSLWQSTRARQSLRDDFK